VSGRHPADWVARAWALLTVTSACYFLSDNQADNDLWVHLLSGRVVLSGGAVPHGDTLSYTAAGLPWVDHEWLTQAAFAAVFDRLGPTALWLVKVGVALLTAWLIWLTVARRSASSWVRGPVMIVVLAAAARGYAIRPQIITYLGVAALLAALDRLAADQRRPAWQLVALTGAAFALWANAHGGVMVGIGILGLFTLAPAAGVGRAGAPPLAVRLAMLATSVAATCLTPYGVSLFGYVLTELRAPHPLTEWQPVQLTDSAHAPFLVLLLALAATLPFARTLRRRPWWAVLIAITAAMAVRQQRHVPLFALCAAAPLADQLDAMLAWLRGRSAFRLSHSAANTLALGLVALAMLQLTLLAARLWRADGGIVYAAEEYPVGAVRFMRAQGLAGNLALPLDWGGYVLWHAAPSVKVSLDGRFATVYPPRVVDDNFAFFRGDDGADAARLLDAYDTTLVLAPRGVATPLGHRSEWQMLYTDQVAALFGKRGTPAGGSSDAPRGWMAFP